MREEPLQNLTANSLGVQYQAFLAVSESITAHSDLATLFCDLVQRLQAVVQFDFVTSRPIRQHPPTTYLVNRPFSATYTRSQW